MRQDHSGLERGLMTYGAVREQLVATLDEIREAGLYKHERQLASAQSAHVLARGSAGDVDVLNFCANNYLGLADHPAVVAAAKSALDEWGFGMASVRFICGTQTQHDTLEKRLAQFLGTEATILFSSCFDANGGVFEVLLDEGDAVISDELNHASIIDGIRLCKASRLRYRNRDMADLEVQLKAASGARRRLVVTDGVFSMDGYLAPLDDPDTHRQLPRPGRAARRAATSACRAVECSGRCINGERPSVGGSAPSRGLGH